MTNTADIDYSHLQNLKSPFSSSGGYILGAVILQVVVAAVGLTYTRFNFLITILVPIGILTIIGLATKAYFNYKAVTANNRQSLEQFATANSFAYEQPSFGLGPRAGTLFEHGHSQKEANRLAGTYQGLPFELFNYNYTVGSGKNQRQYHTQVMEFTLPRNLPHMVIDSLVEQVSGNRSTLPITFDSSQRITLEGDFSKYFHLYAPDSYGVTALTILAPDAMQTLLTSASLCDMEIKDNKLYFYWPGTVDSLAEYKNIFDTSRAVLNEVQDKLTTDDVFGSPTQAYVHSVPGEGIELKKSFLAKFGAIFIFVGLFSLELLVRLFDNPGPVFYIFYLFLFIGPLGYFAIKAAKTAQLRKSLAERYHQ